MQLAALVLPCCLLALSFRLRAGRCHCNGRELRKLRCAERTKSVIGLYYGIANGTGVHLCIVSICGSNLRNPRCSFLCSAKGAERMIIIKLCIAIEAEVVFFNLHLCSAKRTESVIIAYLCETTGAYALIFFSYRLRYAFSASEAKSMTILYGCITVWTNSHNNTAFFVFSKSVAFLDIVSYKILVGLALNCNVVLAVLDHNNGRAGDAIIV